ncbi:hypothetical protein BDDG_02997 [Blastomyces dermatitidis ATCC 18188]|uniref:Uncharacterized protein n=1 Tax=Ajellomyces dermatitidis (strain ATCC 18188 / CBS 674.68) TaxID=653446 RepID=F2T9Z3_AJEDA|nr:hypothetical protein BDDG_02997 [Blastomyces dermatitidis ATCC 18188]
MTGRIRPIEKFAKATAQCSAQATAYGKCVFADYNAVRKDMCAKEFMKLKDCYLVQSTFLLGSLAKWKLTNWLNNTGSGKETMRNLH